MTVIVQTVFLSRHNFQHENKRQLLLVVPRGLSSKSVISTDARVLCHREASLKSHLLVVLPRHLICMWFSFHLLPVLLRFGLLKRVCLALLSAVAVAGIACQAAFSESAKWPWKLFAWPESVLTCRDESRASWLIFASVDKIINVAYRNPDPEIWKEVKCHFIRRLGSSVGFTLHVYDKFQ